MGHALRLRELIQDAIRCVMRRKVPLIYETAKLAHLQYSENIELCKEFETMDSISQECGINVGAADHPLISVIRNVHTGDRDCNDLWSLLPFAYGSSFTSKYWAMFKQVRLISKFCFCCHANELTLMTISDFFFLFTSHQRVFTICLNSIRLPIMVMYLWPQ